jgi:glutathione peroxidase
MKKIILLLFIISNVIIGSAQVKSIYDFKTTTIDGKIFDFSKLKGKKLMIVNTASKCGFTPQYKDLEQLYEKYKGQNFTIIGFPSNDFKEQEPGTNKEIKEFCTINYGVTFPLMSKISVKGDQMDPIYNWLTKKSENGKFDSPVKWNFQKYLVNEKGELDGVALSAEKPFSERIISWIEGEKSTKTKN